MEIFTIAKRNVRWNQKKMRTQATLIFFALIPRKPSYTELPSGAEGEQEPSVDTSERITELQKAFLSAFPFTFSSSSKYEERLMNKIDFLLSRDIRHFPRGIEPGNSLLQLLADQSALFYDYDFASRDNLLNKDWFKVSKKRVWDSDAAMDAFSKAWMKMTGESAEKSGAIRAAEVLFDRISTRHKGKNRSLFQWLYANEHLVGIRSRENRKLRSDLIQRRIKLRLRDVPQWVREEKKINYTRILSDKKLARSYRQLLEGCDSTIKAFAKNASFRSVFLNTVLIPCIHGDYERKLIKVYPPKVCDPTAHDVTGIRLNSMEDPYAPIAPGTEGEVDFVDDIGTIHMKWNNGKALGIVPGEDSFSVLPPKLTTLKLYMPLTADFYERSEYGELEPESTELDGHALRGYQNQIMAELVKNRMPEETERGLMHWYHEADSVNTKVHSAVFTVEERDRKLWGVAECRIAGELSALEMDTLKEYIAGQASDGWGEHFEQWEILVDGGSELYVHLWNADDWGIQTEQERFAPKLSEGLPELCFSVLPSTGELICIKRGENGYYPSDWSTDDPAQNRELADYNNERLGVTQAQRLAMECGSMHGWDVPGADPSAYQQSEPRMGGMDLG